MVVAYNASTFYNLDMNLKKIEKRERKLALKNQKREEKLLRRERIQVNNARAALEKDKISKAKQRVKGKGFEFKRGVVGESHVTNCLVKLCHLKNGYFINDVHFYGGRDWFCQIDHLYIDQSGIYVIETKRWAGIIFGTENDYMWTAVQFQGRVKKRLGSPYLENKRHVQCVVRLFPDLEEFIYNRIIFTGDCVLNRIKCSGIHNILGFKKEVIRNQEKNIPQKRCEEIYLYLKKYSDGVDASENKIM